MTTVTVRVPVEVVAPRGAAFAAAVFAAVASGFSLLRHAHHARRVRHAAASRAAEATALRVYAREVMKTDRRYAADLLAAADRHEQD